MSRNFVLILAASFLGVFVLAIGAVIAVNSLTQPLAQPVAVVPAPPPPAAATPAPSPFAVSKPSVAPLPALQTPSSEFAGGTTGVTVQRSDIDQLAMAVKLGDPASVGKDVWAREVPAAKQLLRGMCDCDQRNWLNHFIETGDEAVSGSSKFAESAKELSHLRRSDEDMTSPGSH